MPKSYLKTGYMLCAEAALISYMRLITAVVTQPPPAVAFLPSWDTVWPMVVKALEEEQLQHNEHSALRALAAITARYVGENVTKRPVQRILPEDSSFLRQLVRLLHSSLRLHHRQPLMGVLVLIVTRFGNLFKAPLLPAEKQAERQAFLTGSCCSVLLLE